MEKVKLIKAAGTTATAFAKPEIINGPNGQEVLKTVRTIVRAGTFAFVVWVVVDNWPSIIGAFRPAAA